MGFRFRRSVKILPGLRLNLTTRGISATVGVRGASVNIGSAGTHLNVGLPGTGLSYRTRLDRPAQGRRGRRGPIDEIPEDHFPPLSPGPEDDLTLDNSVPETEPVRRSRPSVTPTSSQVEDDLVLDTPIISNSGQTAGPEVSFKSATTDKMTSPSLRALSALLIRIAAERARVSSALQGRSGSLPGVLARGSRAESLLARVFVNRRRRQAVKAAASEFEKQVADITACLDGLAIDADFELGDQSKDAFLELTRAFEKMKASEQVWDVSARRGEDPGRTKAIAASSVSRSPVTLDVANLPEIDSDYEALHFQNANGADLYLYPYFLALPRPGGGFALMDLREITATAQNRSFTETGPVPQDALVVGYSWAQANKDGSRDQKFKSNRQIPNCYYSELELRSASGLNEVYQFSNAHVATAFAKALALFVSTLPAAPPDAGEMSIEGHAIPALTLPNPPVVPSLMTGGIFVRLILLAGIVGGAVAINTPEGKIYSSALWSRGMEIGSQAMAKFRSHPSEATTSIAVSPLPSPVPAPQPTTTVTATTSPQANAEPPVVTKKTKSSGLSVAATTPNGAAQDQGAAQVQTAPAIPSTKSNSADTNAIQSTSQPPTASEPEVSTAVPQPSKPVAAATAAPVTSAPPASTSLSSDQLARLQQKLIELGYLEGEPENRVTVKVIAAFNHWRRETGRSAVQTIGPDEYSVFMRAINR